MKKAVSSVDVYYLVKEFSEVLVGARVDSVFESGEKTVVLELFKAGEGKKTFVCAPDFACLTEFKRGKPETPSSFVMQLRKNLKGCFVRGVGQHEFDRIIEVELEGKNSSFTLIIELFSRGNIILCGREKNIVGLLEWQKWRDRKLGVGQSYEYPPATVNPLNLAGESIGRVLDESSRDVVRCLAVECGLPGLYAEEVCAEVGVEKELKASELGSSKERLVSAFNSLLKRVTSYETSPSIVMKDGVFFDALPLSLRVYDGWEKKVLPSFNDAVDEYFTARESDSRQSVFESKYESEKKKLMARLKEQRRALERAGEDADSLRLVGDVLFSRLHEIEDVVAQIRALRRKGLSDNEILARLEGNSLVKELNKTELVLEL